MLPSGIKLSEENLRLVQSSTPGIFVVHMPDGVEPEQYDFFAPSDFASAILEANGDAVRDDAAPPAR